MKKGRAQIRTGIIWMVITAIVLLFCARVFPQSVKVGGERLDQYSPWLKGKSIGIVANNASLAGNMNVVDLLVNSGFRIGRIFSPEHGFRTSADAGQIVDDLRDSVTGLPVISLYGKKRKPAKEDLNNISMMVFDLQDVGVRFYTYISTLSYVMEACAENNIPLVVFDRPNPNGFYIDGPVLEKPFSSFVGLHPVPVVYGMTIGEYACMINGEGWLKNGVCCNLKVIPLENYTHQSRLKRLERPSPNLTSMNAILLYPSLCFFEGTVISVGRGTEHPFEMFGHPDLFTGSYIFIPESIRGMSLHPPYENRICYGTNLQGLYDVPSEPDGKLNLFWLISAYHSLGNKTEFFTSYFDLLAGTDRLRKQIIEGLSEEEIKKTWQDDLTRFKKIRKKYLLYPE